mmetsp:Transcript_64291/g.119482  ORF Transcript_64291/g.119482 Transcript_64291/m.119482 type:complete len:454 (-) Transcript_64291:32-1393(-)
MAEQGVYTTTGTLGSHNEEVEGLHELFSTARIEEYLTSASAILRDWGAVDITEVISDPELVGKLEEELKLKLLEKRRLQAAIKDHLSQAATVAASPPAAPAQDGPPGIAHPGGRPHASLALDQNVIVRNTFVDVDQLCSPSQQQHLQRTQTAPPAHMRLSRQASVPESVQSTDDVGVSRGIPPGHCLDRLDRTITHDNFSYDSADSRTWLPPAASMAMQTPPLWPPPLIPPPPWFMSPQMYNDFVPDHGYPGQAYQHTDADGYSSSSGWKQASGLRQSSSSSTGANTKNAATTGDLPGIRRTTSEDGKTTQVWWAVSTKKLRSTDTSIVSPGFECVLSPELPAAVFKLIIYPKVSSEGRDGANFLQSKGRGCVKLVAADPVPESAPRVSFSLSIGPDGGTQFSRGPVVHNFSEQKVCGLPEEEEEWNFKAAFNQGNAIFMVNVQITPVIDSNG